MDEEILGGDEDFEVIADNTPQTPDDNFFTHIVQALQQIVVDDEFEHSQAGFMREHCQLFEDVQENKKQYMSVFNKYQALMSKCLETMLAQRVNDFQMGRFLAMLPARVHQIDQEIYEILNSLSDFQVFKSMMIDYKTAHEEEARLKTIKSVKISELKKVQGVNDNIFGSAPPNFANDSLIKKKSNAGSNKQKTQEEILMPDFLLTIRPLRKG